MIKFIGSFETAESLPKKQMPEYAFVGRSNVGKSSLLNALVGQKIARTSNTPGRTQSINLFEWSVPAGPGRDSHVMLADLPGYGYAKASKTEISKWALRLEKYLLSRAQMKRVFILVDSRHGLKPSDLELMQFCDENAVRYQIILTKTDKIKKVASEKLRIETEELVKKRGAACSTVHATSADKKCGIEELKGEIAKE
ncbi:MAG: ribosome biogenesis GTP-binding protein YihA/YsxC [Rickettsiales bacterium]|jgi:GTP-binding protein|nr:ribosome biogenesis GTP-binding protein YihA/YsxC [Rickettsiales bacterium]